MTQEEIPILPTQAVSAYSKFIQFSRSDDPLRGEVYYRWGESLFKQRKFKESIQLLEKVVELEEQGEVGMKARQLISNFKREIQMKQDRVILNTKFILPLCCSPIVST